MKKCIFFLLMLLLPLVGSAEQYKQVTRYDSNVFTISSGLLSIKPVVSGALSLTGDLTLENSEVISNATNGTIALTAPVFKQLYDAQAYWTATQADGAGVTLDSVSDGTAGFTFSDPVTLATGKTLTIGTEVIARESTVNGLNVKKIARATFDPSGTAGMRTVAAHGLGVTLPDNAIITRAWYDVVTTLHSPSTGAGVDKATIAISVEGANDVVTATAIEAGTNIWDAGLHEAIPVGTTATMVKTSAAREITATVGVDPLDLGKLIIFVEYVVSD